MATSLYAFPSITLPPRAISEAQRQGVAPDVFYCLELLKETGIATTPGSGFGQKDGTFHFRTTILPPEEKMEQFAQSIKNFHLKFLATFGDREVSSARNSYIHSKL